MPALSSFDYAIIRVVPRVERGECINAGVIVFCRTRRFLAARVELDATRLSALDPTLDVPFVQRHLATFPLVCAGGPAAGPVGMLTQAERFHWLVAPRSTIIQLSPVHSGLCAEPDDALHDLLARLVRPATPSAGPPPAAPAALD